MDFLDFASLTVLEDAVRFSAVDRKSIDLRLAPWTTPRRRAPPEAQSVGIFQLESVGCATSSQVLRTRSSTHLITIGALFRPGPIQSGMIDDFAKRKHGSGVTHMHPSLKLDLEEDVRRDRLPGPGDADREPPGGVLRWRRPTSSAARWERRCPRRWPARKSAFVEGCAQNKVPKKKAEEIFDL